MQKDNRITQHERTSFEVSHKRKEPHTQFQTQPITCFFQATSVPVVQPVVTGIDNGPSDSSVQHLTVSASQKKIGIDVEIN